MEVKVVINCLSRTVLGQPLYGKKNYSNTFLTTLVFIVLAVKYLMIFKLNDQTGCEQVPHQARLSKPHSLEGNAQKCNRILHAEGQSVNS